MWHKLLTLVPCHCDKWKIKAVCRRNKQLDRQRQRFSLGFTSVVCCASGSVQGQSPKLLSACKVLLFSCTTTATCNKWPRCIQTTVICTFHWSVRRIHVCTTNACRMWVPHLWTAPWCLEKLAPNVDRKKNGSCGYMHYAVRTAISAVPHIASQVTA